MAESRAPFPGCLFRASPFGLSPCCLGGGNSLEPAARPEPHRGPHRRPAGPRGGRGRGASAKLRRGLPGACRHALRGTPGPAVVWRGWRGKPPKRRRAIKRGGGPAWRAALRLGCLGFTHSFTLWSPAGLFLSSAPPPAVQMPPCQQPSGPLSTGKAGSRAALSKAAARGSLSRLRESRLKAAAAAPPPPFPLSLPLLLAGGARRLLALAPTRPQDGTGAKSRGSGQR